VIAKDLRVRFIDALAATGTGTVIKPLCPVCGQRRRLSGTVDGRRVCTMCDEQARAVACEL